MITPNPDNTFTIDGRMVLVVDDCLEVYTEGNRVYVMAKEVNLLPPNIKQRVTNKFWVACKKMRTKEFGTLIPVRPLP